MDAGFTGFCHAGRDTTTYEFADGLRGAGRNNGYNSPTEYLILCKQIHFRQVRGLQGRSQMRITGRTSPWAIGAFVCGMLALGFGPLAGLPAVIVGHKALREIRRTGEGGYGLARVGLTIGYVMVGLTALALAALAVSQVERSF
jgi:hypothetical protein